MPSLVNAVRDIGRLRDIYVVLVRHGFADLARRIGLRPTAAPDAPDSPEANGAEANGAGKPERALPEAGRVVTTAERVRLVAMDLGPSFVKLGQIASTRRDLLPEDWIHELVKLQDEVRPVPFEQIREAVESSLGAPLGEVYEEFEEEPLAAASIAQAHRAVLRHPDGVKQVAVKVQRPGVAETVARDLDILHALAKIVERTVPESRIYQPSALVDQFDRAITAELDFTLEAENAKQFTENFKNHPSARFPVIYRDASSRRVLTMEYLAGYKVHEAVTERGFDRKSIASAAAAIVIKMIFEDGFFHADPHPGNVLLLGEPATPQIGILDLGMVGRLSPEMRERTIDLMMAAIRRDTEAMAETLYSIGTPTRQIDMRAFRAEVQRLSDRYLHRPLKEIDLPGLVAALVQGASRFGLEIPPDFLLVGKALMTIEDMAKAVDPDFDVMAEARPHFVALLRRRYSPDRVAADLWRAAHRLSGTAVDLPKQMHDVLDDLRAGRLTVHAIDENRSRAIERLGRRIGSALLASSCIAAGVWVVVSAPEQQTLATVLFVLAAVLVIGQIASDLFRR